MIGAFLSSRWWTCSSSCSSWVSGWWLMASPNKASSSTMKIVWIGSSVGCFTSHTSSYLASFPKILIVSGFWESYTLKNIYIFFYFSCNNLFQYFFTHIYSPPKASTLLITNEDVIFLPADTEFDMNSCSVNATDPLKPKCPVLNENQSPVFPEWLTIIMLCVYLLFANILLLNLLIAIFKWVLLVIKVYELFCHLTVLMMMMSPRLFKFFLNFLMFRVIVPHSFTFEEVQDNTDKIWKFQRYELIKEYHSRPAAPPPFIIFSHIYLFIRSMVLRRPPKIYKEFSKCWSVYPHLCR